MIKTYRHQSQWQAWYRLNWRWWVLGTLFLATFVNYFDRQTLGVTLEPISREFGLGNVERGNLLSAFIFTYAFTHLFIGIIIDRIRAIRYFFLAMVVGWSLCTLLAGFSRSYEQLLWLRYLLGVFEAVNFPICLMIIARIFPASERTLASGIFASGAFLATLAAPPMVIYFANAYNWRYSFIMAGAIGLLWAVPWLLIFKRPSHYSAQWLASMAHREEVPRQPLRQTLASVLASYRLVLRAPGFWAVSLIGIGIIPSLYFATQWFPSYFTQGLGHSYDSSLSVKLMVIYFMQDIGLWVGGAVVLWLTRRGKSILASRKMAITGAFVLMLSVLFVPFVSSVTLNVVFLSVFVLGIGIFLGNQHAFKQDVVPEQVATVAALVGFVETFFTAFVIKEVGVVTEATADFTPIFFFLGGLATFAFLVAHFLLKPQWLKIR